MEVGKLIELLSIQNKEFFKLDTIKMMNTNKLSDFRILLIFLELNLSEYLQDSDLPENGDFTIITLMFQFVPKPIMDVVQMVKLLKIIQMEPIVPHSLKILQE